MKFNKKMYASVGIIFAIIASNAEAQNWSNWERKNSVSQQKAFLVIKQPNEGFCYIKQSYDKDTSKMELAVKGNTPSIITPFYRGVDGDVQYWVDNGIKRIIPNSEIGGASSFNLKTNIINEMKSGHTLYVRIKPIAEKKRTQSFSLRGFSNAVRVLNSPKCQANESKPASLSLDVKLITNLNGGTIVSGKTSLPNNMILMISLRSKEGGYFAQDKLQVRSGVFKSAAFTRKGTPLQAGKYRISISSPHMGIQPEDVKQKIGSSGRKIPKDIRKKSSFSESYIVNYSVYRNIK